MRKWIICTLVSILILFSSCSKTTVNMSLLNNAELSVWYCEEEMILLEIDPAFSGIGQIRIDDGTVKMLHFNDILENNSFIVDFYDGAMYVLGNDDNIELNCECSNTLFNSKLVKFSEDGFTVRVKKGMDNPFSGKRLTFKCFPKKDNTPKDFGFSENSWDELSDNILIINSLGVTISDEYRGDLIEMKKQQNADRANSLLK